MMRNLANCITVPYKNGVFFFHIWGGGAVGTRSIMMTGGVRQGGKNKRPSS